MTSQSSPLNPEQDRDKLWEIAQRYACQNEVAKAASILRAARQLGRTAISTGPTTIHTPQRDKPPSVYDDLLADNANVDYQTSPTSTLPVLLQQPYAFHPDDTPSSCWIQTANGPNLRVRLKGRPPRMIPIEAYRHIIMQLHRIQLDTPNLPVYSIVEISKLADPAICPPRSALQTVSCINAYLMELGMVVKNQLVYQKAFTITAPDIRDARHDGLAEVPTTLPQQHPLQYPPHFRNNIPYSSPLFSNRLTTHSINLTKLNT